MNSSTRKVKDIHIKIFDSKTNALLGDTTILFLNGMQVEGIISIPLELNDQYFRMFITQNGETYWQDYVMVEVDGKFEFAYRLLHIGEGQDIEEREVFKRVSQNFPANYDLTPWLDI